MLAYMSEYVRTTIKLREDIFQMLKKEAGKKGISEVINRILEERLIKRRSLFGTMPRVDVSDVRDHEDRV